MNREAPPLYGLHKTRNFVQNELYTLLMEEVQPSTVIFSYPLTP